MLSRYFILLIILTSCATIKNKRNYNLNITTCENNTRVQYKDSIYSLPHQFKERSRSPLLLTAVNDSISCKYTIYPVLNLQYGVGNLVFLVYPPLAPFGYLADLTNPRRYHYGKQLILDATDTTALT